MTKNPTFIRKVIYLCSIAVLLIPISLISRPATSTNGSGDPGGQLSRLRTEYGLSQAELGEIDPASSTMQLATLGLRGPAATILWNRAIDFQKKERWDSLSATLNQIAKIQPHMISVWKFQAWNIAYNVSVEFDDYQMRYHWVKKGVDFMLKGTRHNANSPKLLNDLGWFFSHKFGRSDEYRQFRREFKIDKEFHETLPFNENDWDIVRRRSPDGLPDNWLVSWLWNLRAQEAAKLSDRNNLGASPLIFYAKAPMTLMYFAPAIEEDGYLDEKARQAWRQAGEAWDEYGDLDLTTSLGDKIRLNNLEHLEQQIAGLELELTELTPGVERTIEAEREANLSPEQLEALKTPRGVRTSDQYELAAQAEREIAFGPHEIAERAPPEVREQALLVADLLIQLKLEALYTNRYRQQINYPYWAMRAEVEQSERAVEARRSIYEANQDFREARLEQARESYEHAWVLWGEIFAEYPSMLEDTTAEDLMESVDRYARLLDQLEVSFPPEDFPLMNLLEVQNSEYVILPSAEEPAAESAEDTTAESAADAEAEPTAESESTEPAEDTPSADAPAEPSGEDTTESEPATTDAPDETSAAEETAEPAEAAAETPAPLETEPATEPADETTQPAPAAEAGD